MRNYRVLNNLNISGSIVVSGSSRLNGDSILGDDISDTIYVSGTLKNNGNAYLTGSFSGSGEGLYNLTSSGIQNFVDDVRKQLVGINPISYNPATGEISYAGAGGTIYTEGNITGSGTSIDPIRTKQNITGSSITASVGISASYYYGDGSNLTGLMQNVYTAGNITGSGTSGDPIGILPNPIFSQITASAIYNSNDLYIDSNTEMFIATKTGDVETAELYIGHNNIILDIKSQHTDIYADGTVDIRAYDVNLSGTGTVKIDGPSIEIGHYDMYFKPTSPIYLRGLVTSSYDVLFQQNLTVENSITASYFTGSKADISSITASVGVSGSDNLLEKITTNQINFNGLLANPTQDAGLMWFDETTQQLRRWSGVTDLYFATNEQIILRVHNNTGSPIAKASVVHLTSSNALVPRITLADFTSDTLSANTIGLTMHEIAHGADGYVITNGMLYGFDTTTPGYVSGDILYLSGSGGLSKTKAVAPNHLVTVAQVVREGNSNNGSLYVKIQNGYELEELHDILVTSPESYDLLIRDADGLWKNTKNLAGNYTFSGNNKFTGSLNGTASYASDADKLDGQDSSLFALKTDVTGVLNAYALSVNVSSSFGLKSDLTASYANLGQNNTFTGINSFNGQLTASNAFFNGDVYINGTASIAALNTINQQSLNIGDKYIIILSGASDHASLDGSGILWGSGSITDPTKGPLGEMAYVRYYASLDKLEIFPGLKISGSLTASHPSSFSQITSSDGYTGRLYDTASYSLDADKLDGQDSSLFALKTDVTGALTPYLLSSTADSTYARIIDVSSSFGLKSDLTASYARLAFTNTFSADQTITGSIYVSSVVSGSQISGSHAGDGSQLTNVPATVTVGGNITGSGTSIDPLGTNINSTFTTLTASTGFAGGSFSGTNVSASTGLTGSNLHVVSQAEFDGGVRVAYSAKTGNYTLTASSDYVVSFSGSNLTGTLPNAANILGTVLVIKNLHTSSVFVSSSVARIDGSATGVYINGQYTSYTFLSDNTNWLII